MKETPLIAKHRLEPHPYEGWWRQTGREPGVSRKGLQLLRALDEAHWHKLSAAADYKLVEGGPLAISVENEDGSASAFRLSVPGESASVQKGQARALACLGQMALFEMTLTPDIAISDRAFLPDDWYPKD